MKGRPPKPKQQKEREGNPGKRSLDYEVPEPEKPKVMPRPPNKIGDYARDFWKAYGPGVYGLGLLTVVDVPAWTLLCESYQRYKEAGDKRGKSMSESSANGLKKNHLLTVQQQELAIMEKLMIQFGMTPVARERIRTEGGKKDDPFGDLMGEN